MDKLYLARFEFKMRLGRISKDLGPRLNIKTVFPWYGDSHVKDKMVGDAVLSLTWESLYWQDDIFILRRPQGPRLNITLETTCPRYGDFHVKDKTVTKLYSRVSTDM